MSAMCQVPFASESATIEGFFQSRYTWISQFNVNATKHKKVWIKNCFVQTSSFSSEYKNRFGKRKRNIKAPDLAGNPRTFFSCNDVNYVTCYKQTRPISPLPQRKSFCRPFGQFSLHVTFLAAFKIKEMRNP